MIRTYLYAAAIAAVLALGSWWHLSRVHAAERAVHAHYAQVLAEISAKTAQAEAEFRRTERVWQDAFDKEARDGQTRIAAARADADAAHVAGDSLRAALNRRVAAAKATERAVSAQRGAGQLDPRPVDLLAGMLARHTRELEVVGGYADELRVRGETCERSADALMRRTPSLELSDG